jgi:hypothetical protein
VHARGPKHPSRRTRSTRCSVGRPSQGSPAERGRCVFECKIGRLTMTGPQMVHRPDGNVITRLINKTRKSPLTRAFTQNQRADSDRRDDRIRTCDPLTPRAARSSARPAQTLKPQVTMVPLNAIECSPAPLSHLDSSHLTPTPPQNRRLRTGTTLVVHHHIGTSHHRPSSTHCTAASGSPTRPESWSSEPSAPPSTPGAWITEAITRSSDLSARMTPWWPTCSLRTVDNVPSVEVTTSRVAERAWRDLCAPR